jgi:hypothetical protein
LIEPVELAYSRFGIVCDDLHATSLYRFGLNAVRICEARLAPEPVECALKADLSQANTISSMSIHSHVGPGWHRGSLLVMRRDEPADIARYE